MGAMQNPDFKRAPLGHLDNYGEKTSEHGHYELVSQYKSGQSNFAWVEDNRQFSAPAKEPQQAEPANEEAKPAYEPVEEQPQETENSAADTYKGAFDRAVEAGKDITANDYLAKTNGQNDSRNRFMDMAQQGMPLPQAETNDAAQYDNVKPPELLGIAEDNSNYNGDLNNL